MFISKWTGRNVIKKQEEKGEKMGIRRIKKSSRLNQNISKRKKRRKETINFVVNKRIVERKREKIPRKEKLTSCYEIE